MAIVQCIIKQQYFKDSPADCLVFRKLLSALINQDKEQGITYSRKGLVEKKCPSYIGVKRKRQKKNIFVEMMLHELFLLTTGLFGCEWK